MPMPGPTSAKNSVLAGATTDLGLGDALSQQLQDNLDEQRKLRNGKPTGLNPNSSGLTPAVQSLLGTQMGAL